MSRVFLLIRPHLTANTQHGLAAVVHLTYAPTTSQPASSTPQPMNTRISHPRSQLPSNSRPDIRGSPISVCCSLFSFSLASSQTSASPIFRRPFSHFLFLFPRIEAGLHLTLKPKSTTYKLILHSLPIVAGRPPLITPHQQPQI